MTKLKNSKYDKTKTTICDITLKKVDKTQNVTKLKKNQMRQN